MSTQNKWVKGDVDDAGRVTWYALNGPNGPYPISYNPSNAESFLTVLIDGKYYTNSDQSPQVPRPPDCLLSGAAWSGGSYSPVNTRLLSKAGDGKDTIRSTWTIGKLKLVQEIYPFEFEKSGQIVIRVRIENYTNVPVSTAAQYLLDIDVDNDKAKVLTRWGYSPNWNQYQTPPAPNGKDVPWFYMGFKDPLPTGAGGESSTGYLDKKEEGLLKPYRVTIGDWNDFVPVLWGPPVPLPNQEYKDDAILMEWPGSGAPAMNSDGTPGVVELMRTSYGTGEFEVCSGKLFALSFYPHRLKCLGSTYDNNPFDLETLVFNTDALKSATAVNVNLHVTDPLTVVGPGTPRNGGHDCTVTAPSGGTIDALGVADLVWNVQSSLVTNCSHDSSASLTLTATASGLGMPVMGDCEMPLIVECCDQDKLPPDRFGFTGSELDSTFTVHDNRASDKGLNDILWTVTSGSATDFNITVNPPKPIANCPKTDYTVHVVQKDSTKGGCIDFTFVDCANNTSYYHMCFSAHAVPDKPDIANPVITQIGQYHWPTIKGKLDSSLACTAQVDTFRVTDIAQYDRGLHSISLAGAPTNMTLLTLPFKDSSGVAGFSVSVLDSMLDGSINVVAKDVVGHTDTARIAYCTTPDTTPPVVTASGLSPSYVWTVVVTDSAAWDRGLADIAVTGMTNVTVTPVPTPAIVNGKPAYQFDISINDHYKDAAVCISATDLAGNISSKLGTCLSFNGQTDIWKPNINVTPSLTTNPISIQVRVDDIHLDGTDTVQYDTGVDSVWFTGVYNMTLQVGANTYVDRPGGPHDVFPAIHNVNVGGKHPFASTIPVFTLSVTDTGAVDSLACITIHAADGRGVRDKDGYNVANPVQWCYPLALDSLAPLMSGTSPDRTHIQFHVTDDRFKDRGLKQVQLKSAINFDPIPGSTSGVVSYNGDTAADFTMTVTQPGKSSVASIEALDLFGSKLASPPARQQHTSSADIWVYAQNLKMKVARLITQAGDFDVPIYLDSTDAVPVLQKQIGGYHFGFHVTGSNLINFSQVVTAGTLSNGWAVTATPGASRDYVIDATAVPAGSVLSTPPGASYYGSTGALPLLILRFHGDSSEYAGMASVIVDGEPGAEIAYNGGGKQILTGNNSVVEIPKPYGTVTGGNVVLKGYCSPVVGSGTKPSIIALERVTPTPATKGADQRLTSEYTIPESDRNETHVAIELWSITGEKIATLIDQDQAPGRYELSVPTSSLSAGTYILRLVANNVVISRRAIVR